MKIKPEKYLGISYIREYVRMQTICVYVDKMFLCRQYVRMQTIRLYADNMYVCRQYICMYTICSYVDNMFVCRHIVTSYLVTGPYFVYKKLQAIDLCHFVYFI